MKKDNENMKRRRCDSSENRDVAEVGNTSSVLAKKSRTEEHKIDPAEDGCLSETIPATVKKTDNPEVTEAEQRLHDDKQDNNNKGEAQDEQLVAAGDLPQRKRKRRVRVKKVREDLKQQMEFYFCDANLRKDRFMSELVSKTEGGWVEVSTFLNFNKIKSLLEEKGLEIGEVIKAIRGSELLEVSDDSKKIRRNLVTHPVKVKNQQMVDDCTVYVQGLQPIASVDWLRGVFAEFGHVDYVSLPRAPNGRHKGFGFVEFAEVIGAENACKFYNLRGGGIGPEGECLNTSNSNWGHAGGYGASFANNSSSNNNNIHGNMNHNANSQHLAQRANLQVISKKEWLRYKNKYLKLRKQSAKNAKKYLSVASTGVDLPAVNVRDGSSGHEVAHEAPHEEQRDNNVTGKRTGDHGSGNPAKKARAVDGGDTQAEDAIEEMANGELQKEAAAEDPTTARTSAQPTQPEKAAEPVKQFEQRCIVKIEASKGLLKADKASIRLFPGVAYVDMIENDPVAFVRFNSPAEAVAFATSQERDDSQRSRKSAEAVDQAGNANALEHLGFKQCAILEGEEEANYWQRVEMMRGRKKQSTATVQKDADNTKAGKGGPSKGGRRSRGRERLKAKYEKFVDQAEKKIEVRMNKHIVFDDD